MSPPKNTHENGGLSPQDQELEAVSIMGREVNMASIRALEEQIEEGNGDIIKLKRARNSLLNISARLPPEILGDIFAWCPVWETGPPLYFPSHFDGLKKGSYNFLLVCHHWFEVASRTPELWSFWGITFQEWEKHHHRWAGTAPLDLVLDGGKCDPRVPFDGSLRDAVRFGVMRDTIRQIHLRSDDWATLPPIIFSLTPDDESAQNENIESIVWRKGDIFPLDITNFFARSRLSKLRFLALSGYITISSWDRFASRTTLLTTLSLEIFGSSPPPVQTPTTTQLLSILFSNPNLQELRLADKALPEDSDRSTQVPLRHLRVLSLSGEFHRLFRLLCQLILPETLHDMTLTGFNPTVEEISQNLGPYMLDYFQRGTWFQERLEISSCSTTLFISISVGVVWAWATPRVTLGVAIGDQSPPDALERMFLNLILPVPRECVFSFTAGTSPKLPAEAYLTMPNIEALHLFDVEFSEGFLRPGPDGPHANTKLFPSLRSLCLEDIKAGDDDWGHFITYLTHQTSAGQAVSLKVIGDSPAIPPEVVDEIKGLVEEFTYHQDQEAEGGSSSSCGCSAHEDV